MTQPVSFTLGSASLLLGHPTSLRQAALAQAAASELLPQLPHLQQQKLGQTFWTLFVCREKHVGLLLYGEQWYVIVQTETEQISEMQEHCNLIISNQLRSKSFRSLLNLKITFSNFF